MNEAADEPTAKRQKQTVLGCMREFKNLRDPLCHPAEVDFTREDSFRLLDCGRRVLSRLGHSEEAIVTDSTNPISKNSVRVKRLLGKIIRGTNV